MKIRPMHAVRMPIPMRREMIKAQINIGIGFLLTALTLVAIATNTSVFLSNSMGADMTTSEKAIKAIMPPTIVPIRAIECPSAVEVMKVKNS